MKRIILTLIVLMPLITMGQLKFQTIKFEEAIKKAAAQNKGVLVDVASGRIDKDNIAKACTDKETVAMINDKFITIRVDMMKPENEEFGAHIPNLGYPLVAFYTNRGELVGTCYWDEIAIGRQTLKAAAESALDKTAEKRMNTRKIEFRPLTYTEALQAAKKENKLVFIDCVMEHCGPCRRMENEVFNINQVADLYNKNFICIWNQRENDDDNLAEKFGLSGYPTFLFIDGDGKLVYKADGFQAPDKFSALAKRAIEGEPEEVKSVPMMASTAAVSSGSAEAVSTGASSAAASTGASSAGASASSGAAIMTTEVQGEPETGASLIPFEKLTLAQAMAKAAKENKMIYVDLSATWCGPCQQLKKTTFKDPSVIEYMTQNYVPIAFECDKDEEMSMEYRNKYKSTAFPTHLIIDKNGELVHKFVGFHRAPEFIAEMRNGTVTEKGLGYYIRKYEAGERSPEFMGEYISLLAAANEGATAAGLAGEYLNTLSLDELATPKNFTLVYEFARDIDSELAKKVMDNQDKFKKAVGEENLNMYIYMIWSMKADSFKKEADGKKTFDEKGFDECCKQMEASGFKQAKDIRLSSRVRAAIFINDWDSFMKITTDYMHKNGAKASPMITCNWGIDMKSACQDKQLLNKYADELEKNFELIKASGDDQAIVWKESIKIMIDDLRK